MQITSLKVTIKALRTDPDEKQETGIAKLGEFGGISVTQKVHPNKAHCVSQISLTSNGIKIENIIK